MDDLIVIILTLIVAVIGTIGQIKKKKKEQLNVGQPKKTPGIWGLFQEEPEFPVQNMEAEYYEDEELDVVEQKIVSDFGMNTKREKMLDLEQTLTKNAAYEQAKLNGREKFSLRKAVIYSEIINRKYT